MTEIKFFPYEIFAPDLNMAIDEYFLKHDTGVSVRLYGWQPASISIGHSQDAEQVVDVDFCRRNQIPVVRRSTGGAAVFHKNDITYMVCAPLDYFEDGSVVGVYRTIANVLLHTFQRIGIPCRFAGTINPTIRREEMKKGTACFLVPSDYEILAGGRKMVGSAQHRDTDRMLQHGSIAWHFDYPQTAAALRAPEPYLRKKVSSLAEFIPDLTIETLQNGLIEILGQNGFTLADVPPLMDFVNTEKVFELTRIFPVQ